MNVQVLNMMEHHAIPVDNNQYLVYDGNVRTALILNCVPFVIIMISII